MTWLTGWRFSEIEPPGGWFVMFGVFSFAYLGHCFIVVESGVVVQTQ